MSDKKLPIKINKDKYVWNKQFISGLDVRTLGNIPKNELIFLGLRQPWEDEFIADETRVNLGRAGVERFYSKQVDTHLPYNIIVKGKSMKWGNRLVSREEIIKLAFSDYVENDEELCTVSFLDGPGQNPKGTLLKGRTVLLKRDMKFKIKIISKT